MKQFIAQLTETFGPSGHEDQVGDLLRPLVTALADSVRTDVMGNLIATKKPVGGKRQGKRIMLAAHMDEIGLIVTHIDEKGYLRFATIGGVNPANMVSSRVVFGNGLRGVVGVERKENASDETRLDRLFLDVGADTGEAAGKLVSVGDVCAFDRNCVAIGNRLVAKAMDDRIGCAVLVEVMRRMPASPHEVSFVFTVQEEVGVRGATTSAFGVEPEVALAVDITTTGDGPEPRRMSVSLGKGAAIKVKDRGMLAHAGLKRHLFALSEKRSIPYQPEVLEAGSTDAMAIQMSRAGVATGAVSIPTRYAHSPSEMIDMADVDAAVKLLCEFLGRPVDL